MTTLVSITIETIVQTPKLGLSSKWRIFFPLNNDYILENSSDSFYPMAQIFMRTVQTSSFVDMLKCSGELQPSLALLYIASQQLRKTEVNIHPTEIPLHSTKILLFLHFLQQSTGTMAVDQARFPHV